MSASRLSHSKRSFCHFGGDDNLDTVQRSSLARILLNDFSPDFGKFLFSTESSPDRELMLKILRTVVFGAVAGTETFRDVGARGAAYVARAWSFQ